MYTFYKFVNQLSIPGTDYSIDLDTGRGIMSQGFLSGIGTLFGYALTLMVLVWVVLSLYAAYVIITSAGDPQGIEKGITIIKNIWIGLSSLLIFIVVISIITTFFGFGSVYQWGNNFRQCGGSGGGYYFKEILEVVENDDSYAKGASISAYCCDDGWHLDNSSGTGCELIDTYKK